MNKSYDAIFIMGPQGSGKGTQAKILAEKLGYFHWEMGAVLRGMKEYRFPNGETVADVMDKGIYLSDEQLIGILNQRLSEIPEGQGVIFDGLPRRLTQAEFTLEWLESRGKKDLVTVFISLPREESLKRLELRAAIEKRVDDTPEAIDLRLKQYEEATLPMLGFMREHTRFIEIDGRPAIPEVTKDIFAALEIE